jgi:SAM-dependent methyltransferase
MAMSDDEWHQHSDNWTRQTLSEILSQPAARTGEWALNVGAGVHPLEAEGWRIISVDLFPAPIRHHRYPICASVESLPFATGAFALVFCVGEVLAYCDPAKAISECSRVLRTGGRLIFDFRSTRSPRYWFSPTFRRAADLVEDHYNGRGEMTWVYDPEYILPILKSNSLTVSRVCGIHTWSSLARKSGFTPQYSLILERAFRRLNLPRFFADLITVVAVRI